MSEERYSNREIQLMLQQISDKLEGIRDDIKNERTDFDKRITIVEEKVERLNDFQVRAMTVWAIVVTVVGFALNKFL